MTEAPATNQALKLLMLAVMVFFASCSKPPLNVVGAGQDQLHFAEGAGATVQNIFVTTTRERSEDDSEFFSCERAKATSYANVDVTIPPVHQEGNIERPKSGESDVANISRSPILVCSKIATLSKLN